MLILTTESSFSEYIKRCLELNEELNDLNRISLEAEKLIYERFEKQHENYENNPRNELQLFCVDREYVKEYFSKQNHIKKQLEENEKMKKALDRFITELKIAISRPKLNMHVEVPEEVFRALHLTTGDDNE